MIESTGKIHCPIVNIVINRCGRADDELQELADDIKQRGQLQPIVLDSDGKISSDELDTLVLQTVLDLEHDGFTPNVNKVGAEVPYRREAVTGSLERLVISHQLTESTGSRGSRVFTSSGSAVTSSGTGSLENREPGTSQLTDSGNQWEPVGTSQGNESSSSVRPSSSRRADEVA